ncbi:methylated-DNA--[protein]-cysteine S-methyltransferase [Oxalobacter vibrioformis]|uniref:Methylated-DNA--[protein]-cysteine S-methyltransferase n=1 Tax=Oxalobacter vibrioformis TaxID=933080 RepID=A0A9E9M0F8_9BURK|nr:methylated-DNA--[protein]-cysteine S-methyltransferase [Oxalobacter vibrioformis]WAW10960.1 methylated-DNA--[protein]-cysteine S-methyltransferase [Oxalobacter vibrioformis]
MKKESDHIVNPDSFSAIVSAPFGAVGFVSDGEKVSRLSFLPGYIGEKTAMDKFAGEVSRQLAAYLADSAFTLDFPVARTGTDFQWRVWQEMRNIPVGQTRTYGEVAKRIQSAARAVGGACAINPLILYYPCHRIVAANGIGGFSGETASDSAFLNIKRWLLRHEGVLTN